VHKRTAYTCWPVVTAYQAALALKLIHRFQKLNLSAKPMYSTLNFQKLLAGSILKWHVACNVIGEKSRSSHHPLHAWKLSHLPQHVYHSNGTFNNHSES